MVETQILEEIGLTKSEIKVYLALLELGLSSTGKIVDKSGAASSKIYEVLDRLMQKGLVSYIVKSGVKYFEAADPKRINDYMAEKRKSLEEQEKGISDLIPQLELKKKMAELKSEATIYKGVKGAETAFRHMIDSMKNDDEWLGFVVSFQNQKYSDLLLKLHTWRSKKKLSSRIIWDELDRKEGELRNRLAYTKVKYVPNTPRSPAIINVAGDITLINLMSTDVTVFMIENKEVAASFRNQFEQMWGQETRIVKGLDAVQQVFEDMLSHGHADFIAARGYFVDKRHEYIKKWEERAKETGFTMRNIVDPATKGHAITKFPFAKTKYTLPKEFAMLSVFWIYGDKVVISNWTGKEPIVTIIENKQIHDVYKRQFELLWKKKIM
ncbi:helix-turn-helix domain-containing protein [Candidatus Woesearchaeota archaeon]|nr:helix-turn-helix domain-containing protein [Candidatus Woesearchaeota archaeon]